MDSIDKISYEKYLKKLPELRAKLSKEELDEVDEYYAFSQSLVFPYLDGEIWVDLRNANGLYSISNYCRVRRNEVEYINWEGRILKQRSHKGYYGTMVSVGNKTRGIRVHRECAIHFISNPNNLPMINHKNGIRYDGRFKNIEWCDNSRNQKHSFEENMREHPRPCLGKTGYLCKNSKQVIQLDLNGNQIMEWGSGSEAARNLGVCQSYISKACRENNVVCGFMWRYK